MNDKYQIETKKIQRNGQKQARQAFELLSRLKLRRQKQMQKDKVYKLNQCTNATTWNPQEQLTEQIYRINDFNNMNENKMLEIWQLLITRSRDQRKIVSNVIQSWREHYSKLKQQNTLLAEQLNNLNLDREQLCQKLLQLESKIKDICGGKQFQTSYYALQKKQYPMLLLQKNLLEQSQSNLLQENYQNLTLISNKQKETITLQYQNIISKLKIQIQQLQKQNSIQAKQIIEKQNQIQILIKAYQQQICSKSCKNDVLPQGVSFGNHQQDESDYQTQKSKIQQRLQQVERANKKLEEQLLNQRANSDQLKEQNIITMKMLKEQANIIEQLTKQSSAYKLEIFHIKHKLQQQKELNDYHLYKIDYLEKQHSIKNSEISNRIKKMYEQSANSNSIIIRRFSMDKSLKLISKENSTLNTLIQ